ncbi:conserved unknown protein [Ectocarpus siliculosus]|uniref:CCT-theta n=1 Tax=Ectocarpus siliculosus TaxID=2880 RepID=D8LES4_ECTSI|nr:conserved unknown protein [Ectocarpus siliculosus]|eukprot:CBN79744.1 conserved unknown protein [Ectocarpus siliculosus]
MAKSMGMNLASGLQGMLKDGHNSYEGVDEAIMRNINAAKELAAIVRTSLGPNGMNKLVVNHLDKTIVTSDGATIVQELEVMHPAAKMVVLASQMQEQEAGDGTSLVVTLTGELLKLAADLLREGLHTAEILEGYRAAYMKTQEILPSLVCHTVADVRDPKQLAFAIKTVIGSKQYGFEDALSPFVAEACLAVMPPAPAKAMLAVENVRVCKLLGGSTADSHVVRGMVVQRDSQGLVKRAENAKVAVFACGLEMSSTETKGTVLIRTGEELMSYNKGEEKVVEDAMKSIADAGTKVIVAGGTVSDMCMHFIEKYEMMVIKVLSKWELRRICNAVHATALVRMGAPTPDEMGDCALVEVREVGLRKVTVFSQDDDDSRIATIVLRASTQSLLNDLERAVDDSVACVRGLCRDPRFVPGGGATEMELAHQIFKHGESQTGLDQYAIKKFAEALEVVPRILSETSGQDAEKVLATLRTAHANGEAKMGVDVDDDSVADKSGEGVVDLMSTKESALRLAVDAAVTVLRVDQIIMSKQAGGPKPRAPKGDDE